MSGFRRDNDDWQEKCPCCGRFASPDEGFYMWIADDPEFISLFCDEACARRYEMKGGKFVDGDRQPYTPEWETHETT